MRKVVVAFFFHGNAFLSNQTQSAKSVKQCNIVLTMIAKSMCLVASLQVWPMFQDYTPAGVGNTISISTPGKKIRTLNCHLATETKLID